MVTATPPNTHAHAACTSGWAPAPCLTRRWEVLAKPSGVLLGGVQRGVSPTLPQLGNRGNQGALLEAPGTCRAVWVPRAQPGPTVCPLGPWVAPSGQQERAGTL